MSISTANCTASFRRWPVSMARVSPRFPSATPCARPAIPLWPGAHLPRPVRYRHHPVSAPVFDPADAFLRHAGLAGTTLGGGIMLYLGVNKILGQDIIAEHGR